MSKNTVKPVVFHIFSLRTTTPPKRSEDGPRRPHTPQHAPKTRPWRAQDAAKTPQEPFKTLPDASPTVPRRPKTALRLLQDVSPDGLRPPGPSLVVFGPFLDHFWIVFGSFLDHFWTIFGSFLEHFWVVRACARACRAKQGSLLCSGARKH